MRWRKSFIVGSLFLLILGLFAYRDNSLAAFGDYPCHLCHEWDTCSGPNRPDGQCDACHGNPPVENAISSRGLVGFPEETGATSAGFHELHATTSGYRFACGLCHAAGMTETNFTLDNGIQIGFGLYGFSGAGSQYDGQALNLPYTYTGTNGTAITTGGQLRCSNMYCHSNGTAISTRFYTPATYPGPDSTSPAWDGSTLDPDGNKCNNCHAYPPAYDRDLPKSNSHLRHAQISYINPLTGIQGNYGECNLCHNATTQNGQTIANKAQHVNGIYDVMPAPVFYANNAARSLNFTYAFDAGGGTCSNNSCHQYWGMADPVRWGMSSVYAGPQITQGSTCGDVTFNILVTGGYPDAAPPYWCYYNWGDGTIQDWSQNCSASHTYPGAGSYTVIWGARDNDRHPVDSAPADTGLLTTPVNISCGPPPPTENPTAVASFVDPATNEVIITVTAGILGVERTTINWADGSSYTVYSSIIPPGNNQEFPHTSAAEGTRNIRVTLRTTDATYHYFTLPVSF